MRNNREERREGLRERLLAVTTARIESQGLSQLKARDITAEAGCALGALYTAFGDMDELVMRVNTATLIRMRELIAPVKGETPVARLQAQARAYIAFAMEHPRLWAALFEFQLSPERALPDWMQAEQEALMGLIAGPLAQVFPALPPEDLLIRVRIFFGAVQGAVQLALQDRFIAVPRARLDAEITALVEALCRGFAS
ncbi:WHG domain-containing protein [Xinfangfangia sp. D13-10-4-6]|uniref:TetR-like C-terminal domain-containing protein n=1 Tax=Pseudogemmobacter hezensis TaxID=2737662 RepID=UPI00155727F8|nr:TetR-like C-terminal domain-containing protein [Pseudogemmobacter hezensis]NPD15555.1 WHG domain-containing protein [Pseudogemmobacter hezensis]